MNEKFELDIDSGILKGIRYQEKECLSLNSNLQKYVEKSSHKTVNVY